MEGKTKKEQSEIADIINEMADYISPILREHAPDSFENMTGIFFNLRGDICISILLPKMFWPTVRKNCSSDREKLLKFEAESQDFSIFFRSLEQFIQTMKGQNNFW